MTDEQYFDLIADMELAWGRKIEDAIAVHWWQKGLFAGIEYEDAQAAVAGLTATTQWMPAPADIRRWIAQHASAALDAVWSEVWDELQQERVEKRPWSEAKWSAAAAPFVAHIGTTALNAIAPWSDTPPAVAYAQLRKAWEDWRDREIERRVTGDIPAVAEFNRRHSPRLANPHYPELAQRAGDLARRHTLTD